MIGLSKGHPSRCFIMALRRSSRAVGLNMEWILSSMARLRLARADDSLLVAAAAATASHMASRSFSASRLRFAAVRALWRTPRVDMGSCKTERGGKPFKLPFLDARSAARLTSLPLLWPEFVCISCATLAILSLASAALRRFPSSCEMTGTPPPLRFSCPFTIEAEEPPDFFFGAGSTVRFLLARFRGTSSSSSSGSSDCSDSRGC